MTSLAELPTSAKTGDRTHSLRSGNASESSRGPLGPAGRIERLDGLRGLSVLFVVVGHIGRDRLGDGRPSTFLAEFGVQCFFVLSGYLITSLLCREFERTRTVDLRAFYSRRVLRLLPAMVVFLAAVAVLKVTGKVTDVPWYSLGVALVYMSNIAGRGATIGHLWSLGLEEQFYLVWPVLFVILPKRRLQIATGIVVAVALFRTIGIVVHLYPYETGIFYQRPWFRFDSLMVGCLFALPTAQNLRISAFMKRSTNVFWLLPVLGLGCVLAVWGDRPSVRPLYLSLQLAVACWLFLHVLLHPRSPIALVLATRLWVWLGALSYSVYLWQQLFCVTAVPDWGWPRRFPTCLASTLTCALVSHHFIERPFLMLKRRFERARVVE